MDPYRVELASSISVLKSDQSRLYAREYHNRRARLGSDGFTMNGFLCWLLPRERHGTTRKAAGRSFHRWIVVLGILF